MGEVSLHFGGHKVLVLKDCLYILNIRRNLISVSCLACNGYSALFNKNSVSILNEKDKICSRMLIDNFYLIEPNTPLYINSHESNHKRKEPSSVNLTHLWHLRQVISIWMGFVDWSQVDTLVHWI